MPKPTVSRLAYTLTELGYLTYSPRLNTYELGGKTLALGYVALSNLDVRRIARPYMAEIANKTNLNVGMGLRDGLMMLHVETCDGDALVGVRLFPGSRMPIATTAMGRAYLSALPPKDREAILDEIRQQHGDDWPMVSRAIDRAIADIERRGFCLSVGDWQKDINGAGAVIPMPDGRGIYAMNVGGPAYLTSEKQLNEEVGPMLARAVQAIRIRLGESD
jgi:DNA-binding IclR family transcriptional regulator